LTDQPFEVLAFPCNQFGGQESGTAEEISAFVKKKLKPFGVDFTVLEKAHVNGKHTHPVYHFLRYHMKPGKSRRHMFPIPWNFSKFLVDAQGQVFKYFGPKVAPSSIMPSIQGLLDCSLQGLPNLPPTISPEHAPPGFAPCSM